MTAQIRRAEFMPKEASRREGGADKTPAVARKVQGYFPSVEMKREFEQDAEERGGVSSFIAYLYRRFKREESAKAEQQNKAA